MSRYRQIGRAPENTLDSIQEQTLFSQEDWADYAYTSTGLGDSYVIDPGVKHRFALPPNATQHLIWIAAGAHLQSNSGDQWFVQGVINFFRAGRPVGTYVFTDADPYSANPLGSQYPFAKRRIMRSAPDGNGSPYTTLRYQTTDIGGLSRKNLDIGCAVVRVLADRAEYQVDAARIQFAGPAGAAIQILTGCRIISMP